MMHPYPFFGSPNFRRAYPYYPSYYRSHNLNVRPTKNFQKPCSPSDSFKKEQGNFSCSSNFSKNGDFNRKNVDPSMHNGFNYEKVNTCKNNNVDFSIINTDDNCDNCDNCDDYDEQQCFEIFGLKLHFDDLLIIALLFFLYQEEVKDTYLYISLILLLLS